MKIHTKKQLPSLLRWYYSGWAAGRLELSENKANSVQIHLNLPVKLSLAKTNFWGETPTPTNRPHPKLFSKSMKKWWGTEGNKGEQRGTEWQGAEWNGLNK